MLSIAALGGNLRYYLDLANIEYFHDGGEPPGQWYGRGAKALGLQGTADKDAVKNLAKGLSPDGSKKLIQIRKDKEHQAGWDLTFSAPKSVSVAWAVADDDLRRKIQQCHDQAVNRTLEFLQDNVLVSRTGKGGKELVKADIVAVTFQHGTSRANDPLLHTHSLIMNIAVSNGKTRTILSKPLYQTKMTAGALYRSELSYLIQRETGLRIRADGFAFKVKGISQAVVDMFSKRRQQVEAALASNGQSSAAAAQRATLETRWKKEATPRCELVRQWQKDAAAFGLTAWSLDHMRQSRLLPTNPHKLVDSSFRKLTGIKSTFTKSDLLRETALLGQVYGVSIDRLTRSTDQFIKNHPEIVPVGADRFTSKSNLKLESELLDMATAAESRNSRKHVVGISIVEQQLVKNGHLSWEQQAAVSHMTMAPGDVNCTEGLAGVGKTTAMKTAADIWKDAGYSVVGACISGKAARELSQHAGIKSFTIAKLKQGFEKSLANTIWHQAKQLARAAMKKPTTNLNGLPKLTAKTVLILDEAGMIGTRDLHEIMTEARKAGSKVVLIGDPKQLQPIDRGTPFRSLLKRLGGVSISEIRRQRDAFDRQVVKDLYDGNARDALQSLKDRGRLHVCGSRDDAMKKMVADWFDKKNRNDPMFAPTRVEVDKLNKECQTLRHKNGELRRWETLRLDGRNFHINDRIMFERTSEQFDVNNGDLGTITGFNSKKRLLAAKLDDGRKVMIHVDKYRDINLGYAMTAHKGQGTTVEDTFVLLGGSLQDQHLAYVQLSRARGVTQVYVDHFEAGEELEGLEQSLKRSNPDLLAREYLDGQAAQHHKKGFGYGL